MANADEKVKLIDTESNSSSVFSCVSRDPRPLISYRGPTRDAATVLSAMDRNNDRMVRL
jgi:hypothetical protein